MSLSLDWLKLLACPACRSGLDLRGQPEELVCPGCGRRYPILDGIPDLVVEDAPKPA